VSGSTLHALARRYFDAGTRAWPRVTLAFAAFEAHFARHAGGGGSPSEDHAADLFLACACAEGVATALASLERELMPEVGRAVASVDPSHAFVEEALQILRERLLVRRAGRSAKIADYAGRASLKSWLRTVAVRTALSQRRRRGEQGRPAFSSTADLRIDTGGPEVDYVRARYRPAFEKALRDAIARLPSQQRLLLRLHVSNRVGIDRLATMYGIGRSTAARWVADARASLLRAARRELQAALHITASECDSLAGEMHDHLEVSLASLLRSGA
jgi:RNA polymerase sigma-70 factor (ECF subfamily)